ncbi:chromatin structure-remodeling complex subunit RSC7 [Elasticomyces elasticus]|uniref:Chromatin structure-remodeling complex subunit RSC7 n=1 Tax=Elasticomyces elasticus TaxID=574655 RepID=A0AAN7WEX9_9PEZI|nr:chromatin structure-remodeling complex subunit RSC7 [Elasticomyces elasticus]
MSAAPLSAVSANDTPTSDDATDSSSEGEETSASSSREDQRERKSRNIKSKAHIPLREGLLGYDIPLNRASSETSTDQKSAHGRFPNALEDWAGAPLAVRERKMIGFMNAITDQPDWRAKVRNPNAFEVLRWGMDLAYRSEDPTNRVGSSRKMFNHCMAELRDYASTQESQGFVPALKASSTVYKSDMLVDDTTRIALQSAAKALEQDSSTNMEPLPGSNDQVLDMIDASLFPLVYGRSPINPAGDVSLRDCVMLSGRGSSMPPPKKKSTVGATLFIRDEFWDEDNPEDCIEAAVYSSLSQWLPAEVSLRPNGAAGFVSYVNNLHPRRHSDLYKVIEEVLFKIIPMWNQALSCVRNNSMSRITIAHQPTPKLTWQPSEPEDEEYERDEDDWEYDLFDDLYQRGFSLEYPQPEPRRYLPKASALHMDIPASKASTLRDQPLQPALGDACRLHDFDLLRCLDGRSAQVIVRMTKIDLTPELPSYAGGKWQMDGQLNEHICATAVYYYDCDNITDCGLGLREVMDKSAIIDSLSKIQMLFGDEAEILNNWYGMSDETPAMQNLGRVSARDGRVVVFPNVLQHRVQPFRLRDSRKAGHCKFLTFSLVDPHLRIPSTAHVPPQREDWWYDMVLGLDRVGDLPPELAQQVLDSFDNFAMTLDEAKDVRQKRMQEEDALGKKMEAKMEHKGWFGCRY